MNTTASSRYLWFERAGMRFAASMDHLQQVLSAPSLRPIPASEPALSGLMILREHVLPVFDPALLAEDRTPAEPASPTVIVLSLNGRPALGVLAEKIGKVVELRIPRPLSTTPRFPAAFSGETRNTDAPRTLLLDAEALAAAMGLGEAAAMAARQPAANHTDFASPIRN